ncbi:MAG TPA: hypothetical protein VLA98_14025, partial [Solirubrobacteraceae bacterium]|nr:hypothetical protein [Solirubrobacteraceae bacterium]
MELALEVADGGLLVGDPPADERWVVRPGALAARGLRAVGGGLALAVRVDAAAHRVVDALEIAAVAALGVMPDEDRLAHRDQVADAVDGRAFDAGAGGEPVALGVQRVGALLARLVQRGVALLGRAVV